MNDVSQSAIQQAVHDATNDLRDQLARLGDTMQRVE